MRSLRSHTLLLLYMDPSHDWNWCLFECGCFAVKRVTAKVDRYQLICLNSGNARPAPLHMWQDVSSQDVFENLLAQYCAGDAHYVGVNPDTVNRGSTARRRRTCGPRSVRECRRHRRSGRRRSSAADS